MMELLSGIATIAAVAAVLIMVIPNIMSRYWQGSGVQRNAGSEVPQASRRSDQLVTNKAPTGGVTGIAATSGAQQPGSLQAQPAQLAAFARQSEQNPVQGITDSEIRFGISAPFSGAAKELGQNMKLGIDAAFNVANANGGVYDPQLRLAAVDDGYQATRAAGTHKHP